MAQPSPLSALSGALKIADKGQRSLWMRRRQIRLNSQGWKDARVIGECQGADSRGAKGAGLSVARAAVAKFERIDNGGSHEVGYGPDDFE
jgi:hypothetical protein